MDTAQIKGHFARLRELDKRTDNDASQEAAGLFFNLAEHFLLEHKRQTDLLEALVNTAGFFETQRREGRDV